MAHLYQDNGKWRCQIEKRGMRKSRTFRTRAEAVAWGNRVEAEIEAGAQGVVPQNLTFADLLDRYGREISPRKRGQRWELVRLQLIARDTLAQVKLRQLDTVHAADWRDRRLAEVSPSSVRREMNLLSNVCSVAVREWRLLRINPFHGVWKPKDARPRDRVLTDEELARLDLAARTPAERRVLAAARFAVETGMRAGEICGLLPEHVAGRVATLPETKNGSSREVPLSSEAVRLWTEHGPFGLSPAALDKHWRDIRDRAGLHDVHFHDTRHTAATRMATKLDVLELCKAFGWRDPRMAMVYYRGDAERMAGKLG